MDLDFFVELLSLLYFLILLQLVQFNPIPMFTENFQLLSICGQEYRCLNVDLLIIALSLGYLATFYYLSMNNFKL